MYAKSIFQKWLNKELADEAALDALCRTYSNLQDSLEPLAEMEREARVQISQIVEHLGGKVQVEGFGELQITRPALLNSYNREKLDTLVAELEEEGSFEIAARIKACQVKSGRIGSLRINRLNR